MDSGISGVRSGVSGSGNDMRDIRYGIVGTGMIAGIHARAIREALGSRLVAVHDCVAERAAAFAREHGVVAETDLGAFLAREDIDVVSITTPSGARAEIAVAAARAGKHVLCEKPLEVTLDRADAIIAACGENGVQLACIFQSRTSAAAGKIRQALASGRLGRLVLVSAQIEWFRTQEYYDSATWRGTWALDGGGVLMNQAIHTLDLMIHLAGRPVSVHAFCDTLTHRDIEVEDTSVAIVRFANGALGTISASTSCAPGFPRRLSLSGEHGSVVLEGDRVVRWVLPAGGDAAADAPVTASVAGSDDGAGRPDAISHEGHRRQIQDLSEAIRCGRSPLVTGVEARRSLELIDGIYESARSGRTVHFPSEG